MPTCAATTTDGSPCRARPVPDSPYCPFHHPDHASDFATGRAHGGAAPRRFRRYPRRLTPAHLTELLGELFIAALNDPTAIDVPRLNALARLASVTLQTARLPGRANDEPAADEPHLLRLAPPLNETLAALLETEAAPPTTGQSAPLPAGALPVGSDTAAPASLTPASDRSPALPASDSANPAGPCPPASLSIDTPVPQATEQALDKSWTSAPATSDLSAAAALRSSPPSSPRLPCIASALVRPNDDIIPPFPPIPEPRRRWP